MREIVLQLKAPHSWVSDITSKHPSTIRILDCKSSGTKNGIRQLVEISSDPNQLHQVVNDLKSSPLVKEAYVVETKRGKIVGSLLTESVICGIAMSSNAFCRTCLFQTRARPDGTAEWTLAFTGREALTELLDRLRTEKVDVKILRLTAVAGVENLTSHQRNLVEMALEEGFFDFPRKITLRQLSEKMGVSASSASEVLRRAEKKILTAYSRPGAVQSLQEEETNLPCQARTPKGKKT